MRSISETYINLALISSNGESMQIKELKPKQGNADLIVDIIDKSQPREFQKFGKPGRVCNAKVKDESGEVTLTLWNEDIDRVKPGMKVKITNGYVNEFQGEMQLTAGRLGKLEIIGKESAKAEAAEEEEVEE